MSHYQKGRLIVWILPFLLLIGVGALFLAPISYYSMKPGDVMDVRPLVHVEGKKYPKGGNFYLTTVSLKRGTTFDYLVSKATKDVELVPIDEILTTGESADQYERRQQENMHSSEQSAIVAAYHYANKPIEVQYEGVEVFQVIRDHSQLKQGDLIQKIDTKTISTTEDLFTYLKGKKIGQSVDIELLRANENIMKHIKLIRLSEKEARAGLGILPLTRVQVKTKPPVKIETQNIGGPSAGLMFSLEVLNQLLPQDLTKGYQIAGTGTISPDGKVGQIGGIEQKIMVTDRKGVSLFFCPKDVERGDENEKRAKAKVRELKSNIKLVPVASLKEAVDYLQKLK